MPKISISVLLEEKFSSVFVLDEKQLFLVLVLRVKRQGLFREARQFVHLDTRQSEA